MRMFASAAWHSMLNTISEEIARAHNCIRNRKCDCTGHCPTEDWSLHIDPKIAQEVPVTGFQWIP